MHIELERWFDRYDNVSIGRAKLAETIKHAAENAATNRQPAIPIPPVIDPMFAETLVYDGTYETPIATLDFYTQDEQSVYTHAILHISQGMLANDTYIITFKHASAADKNYRFLLVQDPVTMNTLTEKEHEWLDSLIQQHSKKAVPDLPVHPLQRLLDDEVENPSLHLTFHTDAFALAHTHTKSIDEGAIDEPGAGIPIHTPQYMHWFAQAVPRRSDWSLSHAAHDKYTHIIHQNRYVLATLAFDDIESYPFTILIPAVDGQVLKNKKAAIHFIVEQLEGYINREVDYLTNGHYGPIQQQLSWRKQFYAQNAINQLINGPSI